MTNAIETRGLLLEKAMGESLGGWTNSWVRERYGPTVAGAKVPVGFHLSGLLIAACCVGLAVGVARRRQVS